MSYSAPSAYKSYLDPWANLDYSNFFAGGAEVSNPKYPLQSYLDAGVALSVYNADTDPEMTYVLKYYPKMKARQSLPRRNRSRERISTIVSTVLYLTRSWN